MYKLITLGVDAEIFLLNTVKNEIISAEGIILGDKYNPMPFDTHIPGFGTCLDCVSPEYTIPPATTAEEFVRYLQRGLEYIQSISPKGVCVAIDAAANLKDEYLQSETARTFGCEPDFNAYTMSINPRPVAQNSNLRSAAAHIHFGYENPAEFTHINEYKPLEEHANVVLAADLHLSVPAVLMEEENERKKLYGKAGAYRPKPYGVEYRTISNFYLKSKELMKWAFNSAHKAINHLNDGLIFTDDLKTMVQSCINNNDKKIAEHLVKEFNLNVV